MDARAEVNLREVPDFFRPSDGKKIGEYIDKFAHLTVGSRLLDKPLGSESFIYPLSDWIPDDFDRLTHFALQYEYRAQDLVVTWLHSNDKPENVAYTIGFLYRHTIELLLKATIARGKGFRDLGARRQRKKIDDHDLSRLWARAKHAVEGAVNPSEIATAESVIRELHDLDVKADGFRYPFGFDNGTSERTKVLKNLAFSSLENLVYTLQALCSWLKNAEDAQEAQRQYEAEMDWSCGP